MSEVGMGCVIPVKEGSERGVKADVTLIDARVT